MPEPSAGTETGAETGGETGTETGGETGDETGGETGEVEPEIAFDPNLDPVLTLLGRGQPWTISEKARHEHGRKLLVLYTVDVVSQWRSKLAKTDAVEADLETLEDISSDCSDHDEQPQNPIECLLEGIAKAKLSPRLIPAELLATYAAGSETWELAEVELPRDASGQPKLLHRKRLIEQVYGTGDNVEASDLEIKLKPYDMDGDKRSEILVVFPVSDLPESYLDWNEGAVAFILDRTDFHVQFATTRLYHGEWQDLSWDMTRIETTFQAKADLNGDGYKDLVVRELTIEERDGGDYDDSSSKERTRKETTCLYDLAADNWSCPDSLGTRYVNGATVIERTSVPVPVPEPTTEGGPPAPPKP